MDKGKDREMKIIVLERDDKIIVTDEEQLTKEFHEQYEKNGNGMDKDDFYYEFFYCEPINGSIDYSVEYDRIDFKYDNWDVEQAYNHIKLCLQWLKENSGFTKYTMFHVLMAINSCGAIGKQEYEALHEKYCNYSD
jgi:hypothetical protein